MRRGKSKIYIGTSGWNYDHWKGIFYPEDLKRGEMLSYYAKHFKTVEINSSFYHLPKESSFKKWFDKTPKDFLFSVKVWRRITHLKKINNIQDDLRIFWSGCLFLKNKLGPLLFQFPPSFKANQERLEKFLKDLKKIIGPEQKASFEFRHLSWFSPQIYQILKKYNFALCLADTPNYPYQEVITANYLYFRLHGHQVLYASKYSQEEIKKYAQKIKKWSKQTLSRLRVGVSYLYFDNDACGYAIENARQLVAHFS